MKKKLVAVAVAGILGMPLAAQAQTANVVLYGRLNLTTEFVKGQQADGSNPTAVRLSSNSSRFGMRGVESLGGGLNAIFQIESSINGDTNSGNLGGRETFVGLQGDWGTFKMGNFLNITDDMHGIFGNAPTYLTSILSTAALWGMDAYSRAAGGFDTRNQNNLRYDSPSFNGLTFSGMVSLCDSSGTSSCNPSGHAGELRHGYAVNVGSIYNNGPIQIGADWDHNQQYRAADLNDNEFTITGGYDFGPVRLAAVYEYMKFDTPTGDLKRNFWGVSGTIPAGPGKIYAFWGHAGNGSGSAEDGTQVAGLVKGSDTKADQWEISYTYPLSKRTQVYAGYVKINNGSNGGYILNINPYPT
ncbi:MAG TPA: porin, partial [Casimicrobiaceae bacterium]